ncbi:MAG: hypothetical protein IKS48_01175 [Eubacterium sp.]|nr:hypothetical protein [Eubacterium sp.]
MIRKNKKIRFMGAVMAVTVVTSLTGCSNTIMSYEDFVREVSDVSILEPVDTVLNTVSYAGEDANIEDSVATYCSKDGLCVIDKKPSYYEVYLDYTGGDYYAVGSSYAETIKSIDFDFAGALEPFLYENIKMAFPNLNGDYGPLIDRINILKASLPENYKNEMEGFAQTMGGNDKGFEADGKLSYEEALLMHMIPDCLRGTNCNALSVWGDKTESGQRITSRTLEWTLGSENQMCMAHAVTHFKMDKKDGNNDYTTFSVLGLLDVLTGINEKGVFVGILDVGSDNNYVCEGKKCYTYELRYALEHMNDARTFGEYMVSHSTDYTFSHNLIITDKNDAFCAEDCVDPGFVNEDGEAEGLAVLRDKDTPLIDGITWDNPDSLCVINSFISEGNKDIFTGNGANFVRFEKFNNWVKEKDKLSMSDVKDIVTRESEERESGYQKLHSEDVFQTIIYDYSTGELNVCFTGTEGVVDHPAFTKISLD